MKNMIETANITGVQGRIVNVSSGIHTWFSGDLIRSLGRITRDKRYWFGSYLKITQIDSSSGKIEKKTINSKRDIYLINAQILSTFVWLQTILKYSWQIPRFNCCVPHKLLRFLGEKNKKASRNKTIDLTKKQKIPNCVDNDSQTQNQLL